MKMKDAEKERETEREREEKREREGSLGTWQLVWMEREESFGVTRKYGKHKNRRKTFDKFSVRLLECELPTGCADRDV